MLRRGILFIRTEKGIPGQMGEKLLDAIAL